MEHKFPKLPCRLIAQHNDAITIRSTPPTISLHARAAKRLISSLSGAPGEYGGAHSTVRCSTARKVQDSAFTVPQPRVRRQPFPWVSPVVSEPCASPSVPGSAIDTPIMHCTSRHPPSPAVTHRHAPSPAVTYRHPPSLVVTRHHPPSPAVTRRHPPSPTVRTWSTAMLIPRRRSMGFIPAATLLHPSFRMALASTVAVVVPAGGAR